MKFLYLEARKGILRCYVLAALLLFLGVNLLKIYGDYRAGEIRPVAANVNGMQEGYSEIYERACGPINEETAGFISSEYKRLVSLTADGTYSRKCQEGTYSGYLFGDFYLFHKYFYPSMEYSVKYPAYMDSILEQAKQNLELYREKGNTADAAKSVYILKHYTGRSIPEFYKYDGWEALLTYDFSDLLILLLLILGIAPVFTREKETGMTLILSSSKRGGWHLLLSKCGSGGLFASVVTVLFSLENFLVFGVLCGFEGMYSPLYAIETYKHTPYTGTILSCYFLCSALKIMGFSIITLVPTLLSACCRKTLYPCLFSLGIGVVFGCLSGWTVTQIWWKEILSLVSPLTLTRGWELLMNLYGASIGGIYVPRLYILFAVQAAVAGLLIFFTRRKSCCKSN